MLVEEGTKIGRWTVVDPDTYILNGNKYLDCRCECGFESGVRLAALRNGTSTQCVQCKRAAQSEKLIVPGSGWNTFYYRYQSNARARELDFPLTKEEFKTLCEQDCFYCGDSPVERKLSPSQTITANGIDRMDSSVGYELYNCTPCCGTCNKMKSDIHSSAFLLHALKIVKKHELK